MRMQEIVQMPQWRQACTLYLCLQGVEVGEGVHGLVGGVVQGRQGEGVQIQQLSVGRVPLWQDQILERHCQEGFCSQPGV